MVKVYKKYFFKTIDNFQKRVYTIKSQRKLKSKKNENCRIKIYKVKTLKELEEAIEKSKKETKSTLIDIKVMPKTMTDGYESFWRVGVAQASSKESVLNAAKAQNDMKKHLIQY